MNRARGEDTSVRIILENTGVATGVMGLQKSQDPGSNKVLLQSREFENNTLLFILTAISTEQVHYEPLLEEIETILELIGTGQKG